MLEKCKHANKLDDKTNKSQNNKKINPNTS